MSDDTQKITIEPEDILAKHAAWLSGEQSSASDGGTRREAIGAFCEKTGIENKALSQFRAGLKIKNPAKRRDWLRSLELLLPVAEQVVFANQEEMDLVDEDADLAAGDGEQASDEDDENVTPLTFGDAAE